MQSNPFVKSNHTTALMDDKSFLKGAKNLTGKMLDISKVNLSNKITLDVMTTSSPKNVSLGYGYAANASRLQVDMMTTNGRMFIGMQDLKGIYAFELNVAFISDKTGSVTIMVDEDNASKQVVNVVNDKVLFILDLEKDLQFVHIFNNSKTSLLSFYGGQMSKVN